MSKKKKDEKPESHFRSIHEPWEPGMDYVPNLPKPPNARKKRKKKEATIIPAIFDTTKDLQDKLEYRGRKIKDLQFSNYFMKTTLGIFTILLTTIVAVQSILNGSFFTMLWLITLVLIACLFVGWKTAEWLHDKKEQTGARDYSDFQKEKSIKPPIFL